MNEPIVASARGPVHVVRWDRKRRMTSDTLDGAAAARLEAALRAGPWWSDRIARRAFREAAREVLKRDAAGGLVLIGPEIAKEIPPAFEYTFEPIALGANDPQLKILSGEKPTREERTLWWLGRIGLVLAAGLLLWLGSLAVVSSLARRIGLLLLMVAAGVFGMIVAIKAAESWFSQWMLIPGGVVIRRRRGARPAMIVCRRDDTVAAMRLVSNGKTVMRMLELWPPGGKPLRKAVSEREGLSFLAAWRSAATGPTDEQIRALFRE